METTIMGVAMTQQLVWDSFDYKGKLPNTLTKGDVCLVRMLKNEEKVMDVPLFIREHLVHQETLFEKFLAGKPFSPYKIDHVRQKLYVSGPPGCGKNVFLTLLAHRYAAGRISSDSQPKRVLMILFRKDACCEIFIIDGQETQRLRQRLDWNEIHGTVRTILEDQSIPSFDLCILDGVRQALDECVRLMVRLGAYTGESKKIQRVVFTTSLQFSLHGGDVDQGYDRDHEKISCDSFTQDDYDSAIANETFVRRLLESKTTFMNNILYLKQNGKIQLQDQNNNEDPGSDLSVDEFLENQENFAAARKYITEKYFYAGGSARFMFEFRTSVLMERLRGLFMELDQDGWGAFANSSIPLRATNAVNSLMQQYKGYATAVSRYVLFEAYDRVKGDLVQAIQAAANMSNNPVLKGWAFELRQLQTIKRVLTNNSQDNSPKQSLRSSERLCFQPVKNGEASFDGKNLTKGKKVDLKSGTIIWCMKWNQGCFDVAFFKNSTLMTLQFTLARSHSLKLQYIRDLKNAIENCSGTSVGSVIHVGVVDGNDNVQGFNFVDIEGAGRDSLTWTRDFTVKTYKTSELEEVAGQDDCFETSHLCEQHDVYTKKRRLESE